MSKIGSVIALSTGGIAVFTMAYVGVASVQGASVSDVPPFSWLVRDVPPSDPTNTPPAPAIESAGGASKEQLVPPMTAGVLGAFVMPSPFDSRELQTLQAKLGERMASVEAHEKELVARARELDEWKRSLDAREAELTALRTSIEGGASSSGSKTSSATDAKDLASWRSMSPLFEEGDTDDLAVKLAGFEPEQAAQILNGLDADRAAALLNALPTASYKPILDAWRRSKE